MISPIEDTVAVGCGQNGHLFFSLHVTGCHRAEMSCYSSWNTFSPITYFAIRSIVNISVRLVNVTTFVCTGDFFVRFTMITDRSRRFLTRFPFTVAISDRFFRGSDTTITICVSVVYGIFIIFIILGAIIVVIVSILPGGAKICAIELVKRTSFIP